MESQFFLDASICHEIACIAVMVIKSSHSTYILYHYVSLLLPSNQLTCDLPIFMLDKNIQELI
jgi:hypothetical protein